MNIPESIKIKETLHGHGTKGMALYGYEDTSGLGIRMEARRKDSRSPFIETWFLDALPNREFPSFAALREAALPLTDEQIEAQTSALYPLIKSVEPDSCGNRCRLCPRPPFVPGAPRQKYDTWSVMIAYSWKDEHYLSLCDSHLEQFQGDAKGLKDAIEEEIRVRMSRSTSLTQSSGNGTAEQKEKTS